MQLFKSRGRSKLRSKGKGGSKSVVKKRKHILAKRTAVRIGITSAGIALGGAFAAGGFAGIAGATVASNVAGFSMGLLGSQHLANRYLKRHKLTLKKSKGIIKKRNT
ncbi:MAG TPA: hypothetical protein VMV95_03690 [Bacillota bacterium]|nr:hypothetical protein [Bacillota bacterium]